VHTSRPEGSASDHEGPEHESQVPARDYSPSVYFVRSRSSIEDRDDEARRQFSENLARSIQERERLDEDWERERLEQEYGLPTRISRASLLTSISI